MKQWLERQFKLSEFHSNVRTELLAGLTTFVTMAYVLATVPNMMESAGLDKHVMFTVLILLVILTTCAMAFYTNRPFALAPGLGSVGIVTAMIANDGIAPDVAAGVIFWSGVLFIVISFLGLREAVVRVIPVSLKHAVSAGIGLFIAIVGLKGAGIIIADPSTLVALGDVSSPAVVLAFVGLLIIGIMWHFKVKGAILWGILITWVLGIIAELTGWYVVNPEAGVYSLIPNFSSGILPPSLAPTVFQCEFSFIAKNVMNFVVIVFAFLFVDLFDTVGTLIGVADQGGLLTKDGKLPKVGAALMSDAVGTVAGACLGTSTVTSYVESTAGVAEGGRTGLTALSTAGMFILALFLSPIFLAIPSFATTPALVFVGLLMMKSVLKMKFDGDIADVLGGFVALIMMPFSYSIANGIMFGIVAWVILKVCTGKIKEIHPVMWVSFGLFVLRIITLVLHV